MVSEFDLPCTVCGHELATATITVERSDSVGNTTRVTVAECPNCGTRHYPESALEGVKSRR